MESNQAKPRISGTFGPGVEVTSGDQKGINIAGGASSGDYYEFVTNQGGDGSFEDACRAVDSADLEAQHKKSLVEAITTVKQEVSKGDEANLGIIELVFSAIRGTAPKVESLVAKATLNNTQSPSIRGLAQRVLIEQSAR